MAERRPRLDQPREQQGSFLRLPRAFDGEAFGQLSEAFARFMGTAGFLIGMSVFVLAWVGWNIFAPAGMRFDEYPFIFLTLMLSLQASYAAPLILLAQNRQADRDRVGLEQDRSRDERNLADTEFLTREVASLRIAMRDTATRDFIRGELRDVLEELAERDEAIRAEARRKAKAKAKRKARARARAIAEREQAAAEQAGAEHAARERAAGEQPAGEHVTGMTRAPDAPTGGSGSSAVEPDIR